MKKQRDLSRSKRDILVPEDSDIRSQQLEVDKCDRLINDAEVIEQVMCGTEYQQLVILSKARLFDLLRESLKFNLTSDEKSLALHNEVRGRMRERMDILDGLSGVRGCKARLKEHVKVLIAGIKNMHKRRTENQDKE